MDASADFARGQAPGLLQRLRSVRARLRAAEQARGLPPGSVTLVIAAKGRPAAPVQQLLAAGERVFGENRVQEAAARWPEAGGRPPGLDLRLIGPLQTNKVRAAVRLFDVIETLDRPRLATALAQEIARTRPQRPPRLFVQVNTGAEPQKTGVCPAETGALIDHCRSCGLQVSGIMAVPPRGDDPTPHFTLLAQIARSQGLAQISMGMSADFETAIACGATCVRIGREIFGPRPVKPGGKP